MSPIYQDNFAMLMHLKRQETETATNSNVSTPAPTSTRQPTTPAASTSTTPPATTSTPTSTSQPPTSTSTSTTVPTSTLETTSSVVTTTSSIPTSTSLATTSSVPSSTLLPTTAPTTTPRTTALVTNTVPSSLSRTTLNIPPTIIRTTSDGQIFTVTAVVGSTESANAQGSAKKPFFQNTGAVVGVFVVVGIVAMALAVMLVTMFIRKRRAKQFDREVQEAAREAAHAHAPIEDDDDYAGAQSYNTHGSQPMSTERPGGYGAYGAAASSWDPYARGAAPGATGYEMHNRRTSAGVGAGYGATDQYNQGYGQGYAQGYGQDTYNTGYGQGYGQQTYQNAAPQNYALAQPQNNAGRAPVQAQMMMPEAQRHSYNTVGAFRQSPSFGQAHPGEQVEYGHAGYDDRYPPLPQQTQQPGQGGQVDEYAPRPSEDAYGGYLPYEAGPSNQSQGHGPNPPAYVAGPTNAGATGDRKGSLGREPSGRSGATRYSQDDDVDEEPRRVLKVANE